MLRFRPLAAEITAPTTSGTASDVSSANVVRAVNVGTSAVLVTLTTSTGTTVGSFTITPGNWSYIDKSKSQKLFAATTDIKLTSITYPQ